MATANNPNDNLSPGQQGQSGRLKGIRDRVGYVLELMVARIW